MPYTRTRNGLAHAVTASCHCVLAQGFSEWLDGYVFLASAPFAKNNSRRCGTLASTTTRNKIQESATAYSRDIDGVSHEAFPVRRWLPPRAESEPELGRRPEVQPQQLRERLERRQQPAVLWRPDEFCVRSYGADVFSVRLFFQPPSIRPTSSSNGVRVAYFL